MSGAASAPLIDWHGLWVVLGASAVTGIGVVVLFSVGVLALSKVNQREASLAVRSLFSLIMAGALAAIVATVAWGLYLIVHK